MVTVIGVPLTRISSGSSTTSGLRPRDGVVGGQVPGPPPRCHPSHARLQPDRLTAFDTGVFDLAAT